MCKVIEDMRREEREEGRAEGRKEGLVEKAIETARKMLALKKYTLEEIVTISGLSLEEIQKL